MISDLTISKLSNHHSSMFHRERFSFKLSNVHPALRRVLYEAITVCVPVKVLVPKFSSDTYDTDDVFVQINFFLKQIMSIPISQDTPLDAKFSINIHNTSSQMLIVKSSELRCSNYTETYFDQNLRLFSLEPGRALRLDIIEVEIQRSLADDNAKAVVAYLEYEECLDSPAVIYEDKHGKHHTVSMLADDILHYTGESDMTKFLGIEGRILVLRPESESYDKDGLHFHLYKKVIQEDAERPIKFVGAFDVLQNNHYLRFSTDGTMTPKDIIRHAIEFIVNMFRDIKAQISCVDSNGGFMFGYIGASKKYAYAIVQTAFDIGPEIEVRVMEKAGSHNSWEIYSADMGLIHSSLDRLIEMHSNMQLS